MALSAPLCIIRLCWEKPGEHLRKGYPSMAYRVKSSCYSPNFIEQTAHCDHKPWAAWVHVRLLLHRRSAAGWAECMTYSALVSFSIPCTVFCWKADSGGFRSASECPCSACLTPYTQTCPTCLPVPLCLLSVVLLFRMLGAASGAQGGGASAKAPAHAARGGEHWGGGTKAAARADAQTPTPPAACDRNALSAL